ncbi:MAG: YhbY family RNA-binding protein [Nanoarchaeota archaeon]
MNISSQFQIGKFGVTPGVIDALSLVLKTHKHVRISVLKSSGRDKEKMKTMTQQLIDGLNFKTKNTHTARIIGFTIILRKHAK